MIKMDRMIKEDRLDIVYVYVLGMDETKEKREYW
jgi:hypothetical protein